MQNQWAFTFCFRFYDMLFVYLIGGTSCFFSQGEKYPTSLSKIGDALRRSSVLIEIPGVWNLSFWEEKRPKRASRCII